MLKSKSIIMTVAALMLATVMPTGCRNSSANGNETYQSSRNNRMSVRNLVREFIPGDIIIGRSSSVGCSDSFLWIRDSYPDSLYVNMFSPYDLRYKGSFGKVGPGPDEILNPGAVVVDEKAGNAYVFDFSKYRVTTYNLDSALVNPDYEPWVKLRISSSSLPDRLVYINDTTGFAREISDLTAGSRFSQALCTFNMATGEQKPFAEKERRPGNRSLCCASGADSIIVEACMNNDLIVIYDFDGNVLRKVKGPHWGQEPDDDTSFFLNPHITPDYIIIEYSGGSYMDAFLGTELMVFNHNGDYIKTLDTERRISNSCYHRNTNRLFFIFDDEMQFGYLDLDEVDMD